MLGVGIIIPVIPAIFFNADSSFFDPGVSNGTRSILYGFLLACYPMLQFFGAPILGSLSDRYGRKPILSLALVGTMIGYLLFAYAILRQDIYLLFFSRMLPGFTGGNISIIMSSIADVSDEQAKTRNFGLVGMAFGLGFIVGPTIGGILADNSVVAWFIHATPFWTTAIMTLANIALVQWYFKETLLQKRVTDISLFKGIHNLVISFSIPNLRSIFSVVLLLSLGFTFFTQFFSVYLIQRFQFSEMNIGILYGWIGIWLAFTQGVIVRRLSFRYIPHRVLRWSIPFIGIGIASLLFPGDSFWFFILNPVIALAQGITSPNLNAVVSGQASVERQGEILGINQSMQSLGHAVPPVIAGYLNALNGNLPLIAASVLTFAGWIVYLLFFRSKPLQKT
jgi:DHA1 family tetracycline resistance protein-like MFS transporter